MAAKQMISRVRRTQDHGTRGNATHLFYGWPEDEYEAYLERAALVRIDNEWLAMTVSDGIAEYFGSIGPADEGMSELLTTLDAESTPDAVYAPESDDALAYSSAYVATDGIADQVDVSLDDYTLVVEEDMLFMPASVREYRTAHDMRKIRCREATLGDYSEDDFGDFPELFTRLRVA